MAYGGIHLIGPRGLSGPPGRMLLPAGAGTSGKPADYANGFIPTPAADSARNRYRQTVGDVPWVPTAESEIGTWARQQTKLFGSPEMQNGINQGQRVFLENMGIAPGDFAGVFGPFSEGEAEEWVKQYVGRYGFPTTPDSGIAMARSFVLANCDQIGLPPEFIAAASLIQNFPDSPESAVTWALNLGSAYLSAYGVPIVNGTDVSSFLSASARAAVAQYAPGVPFGLFETTFDALSDGQLTGDEVKGIVIGAAGYIGAVIGQAFGLPAPIGALLSQLIVGGIISLLSDAFGWGPTDSDKLVATQRAAADAAAVASQKCTDLAVALWLQYQHYWDSITRDLDKTIRDNQEWLFPGGLCTTTNSIRLFGKTTLDFVRDPSGQPIVANPEEVKKGKAAQYRTYPFPLTRECADQKGCPYRAMQTGMIIRRDKYALSVPELKRIPSIQLVGPGCDGTSALAFWGARRYATPFHVQMEMRGKQNQWIEPSTYRPTQLTSYNAPKWEEVLHSDDEYLKSIGAVGTVKFGTEVGPCMTPMWAKFMFRSLEQAAAAVALVQRDIARTVSGATTEYGIKYHMEQAAGISWEVASEADKRKAAQLMSAKTAAVRHMVVEARRRGRKRSDLMNYGLLAAGGGALLGFGIRKIL